MHSKTWSTTDATTYDESNKGTNSRGQLQWFEMSKLNVATLDTNLQHIKTLNASSKLKIISLSTKLKKVALNIKLKIMALNIKMKSSFECLKWL